MACEAWKHPKNRTFYGVQIVAGINRQFLAPPPGFVWIDLLINAPRLVAVTFLTDLTGGGGAPNNLQNVNALNPNTMLFKQLSTSNVTGNHTAFGVVQVFDTPISGLCVFSPSGPPHTEPVIITGTMVPVHTILEN
jgi:hypothetical protein